MATKLFVGNLSFNTTEGDLLDLAVDNGNSVSVIAGWTSQLP